MECVEYFFQGYHLLGLLVNCLPDDAISSLTQLLQDVKLAQDVGLNVLRHWC